MADGAEALAQRRREDLGAMPIRLELEDGTEVIGSLENFVPTGDLLVEAGSESHRIPQEEVEVFTLLDAQ
jgi:hypothetical protein